MIRNLIVHFDGKPLMVRTRDNFRLFSTSFTVGRRVYLEWGFKERPKEHAQFRTFCHECVHVLQYEHAKGLGFLKVVSFLFSYFGKKFLRLLRLHVADMYEDEANAEADSVAAGTHKRISIPAETRGHFV